MPTEPITFGKALNIRNSPVILQDGELVTCSGFSYNHAGIMETRYPRYAKNAVALGSMNLIHRYINWLLETDAGSIRYRWDLDHYCDLYTPANKNYTSLGNLSSSNRPRVADYNEFIFIANGTDKKAFTHGNLYNWEIANPTIAPTGAAGAAGNPNGTYSLMYTFLVMFPNGRTVETAPSPLGSVTVSSQKVTWGGILPCPYTGTGVTNYRKLYRGNTTIGAYCYVTTLQDNTTTTYTDDLSDSTLSGNDVLDTTSYEPPPDGIVDCCEYLQRIFCVKDNYLYPSEPYMPFNFVLGDAIAVTKEGEDLTGVIPWGDQLYIPTASAWYRLQGTNSSTWAIRNTFAERGVVNRHTIKDTRYGILGQWWDGIYLFDGTTTKNLTESKIGTALFEGITYPKNCFAEWDGRRYYFAYSASSTTPDTVLVMDFSSYPELKFYNDDFVPGCLEYDVTHGIKYFGTTTGYEYQEDASGSVLSETIPISLQIGDKVMGNALQKKNLQWFNYDINTGGTDVTVTFVVDGTDQTALTLNHSTRTRKRIQLPQYEGYRISLKLTCASAINVKIYEPWGVDYTLVGT